MMTQNYLAMDFGASSGRGILGRFDGNKLAIEEIHRFCNYFVDVNELFYWDAFRLYHHMLRAIQKTREAVGNNLQSIGVDTWGTDYGLLDKNGQLLGNCRCMRNADATVSEKVNEIIPFRELFAKTGIQTIYGNTVFQLYERKLQNDPALAKAHTMLLTPDLLTYFLTGQRQAEYTIATTTMLYNPTTRGWDMDMIRRLSLPEHIFPEIVMPGSTSLNIRQSVLQNTGLGASTKFVPVGSHDTASAIVAAPLQKGQAFCSSGTWSLFGVESAAPVLSDEAFALNFANEGTVDGGIRLLKNIMGMWILQQCQEEWTKQGLKLGWDEIVAQAKQSAAHKSFIDLENPVFYNAGNMVGKIQNYCRDTNQPAPETVGEIARCVYESIAFRYRLIVEQIEIVTGEKIDALRIVGGGCQNGLLNQFAANATGIPVLVGPVESACAGNILVQAMAQRELASTEEIRQVVARSFPVKEFEPQNTLDWNAAFEMYCEIVGAKT